MFRQGRVPREVAKLDKPNDFCKLLCFYFLLDALEAGLSKLADLTEINDACRALSAATDANDGNSVRQRVVAAMAEYAISWLGEPGACGDCIEKRLCHTKHRSPDVMVLLKHVCPLNVSSLTCVSAQS